MDADYLGELAAREAELAGWKEEAERSHRNVAYWQAELARLREHLQSLQATCDRNAERANRFAAEATKAEAELATLRGALDAIVKRTADLRWRDEKGRADAAFYAFSIAEDALAALATPPRLNQPVIELPERSPLRQELADTKDELATLRGALERVIENPHGCRFCDAGGVLRRPDRRHDDDCPYLAASAALATRPRRTPEDGELR
jgi:DNA repair exonuclease SbcCD ATPase subunit